MDYLSDLRSKYRQCKSLVHRLKNAIATQESTIAARESAIAAREGTIALLKSKIATKEDNLQKGLEKFLHQRRLRMGLQGDLVDVEAMLVEERRLREAAEEKIKEHAAQIDAIKLECKHSTESKLKLLSDQYENKVQSMLDVSKNQVGIPSHIPLCSSSPESNNDDEPSVCDRTMMIDTLRRIQLAAQATIPSNPELADHLLKDATGMFKVVRSRFASMIQRQVIGWIVLPLLFSTHGHDQAIFMS